MEYNLRTAMVELKKQEEAGINYIYAKTYNYVYLRAKNILRRENDVQQLMRDVYLKMLESSAEIEVENLYEWLGKCVYRLGCGYYRKKKTREAEKLEMENGEFENGKISYPEATTDVISKSLGELPDLYQATFYAFYYDYMKIDTIAELMDCTEGVIINRLNYTRKYLMKALENYYEEKKIKVVFSVEAVCTSLRKWSVDHCLGITAAQTVYADICKSADIQPAPIYLEGKEFAGVNNTVVYHKTDDFEPLRGQFEEYGMKPGPNKKVLGVIAGIAILVAVIVLAVTMFAGGGNDKKEDGATSNKVEEQEKAPVKEETKKEDKEEVKQEEIEEEDTKKEESSKEENKEETKADDSEYIFPESNTRLLSRAEVEARTKEELRLARNEIFARHGMIFGGDLEEYFSSKSWYRGTVSSEEFYDKVEMSLTEEENIILIQEVESAK
jgi:DNA-directed RNA polymerase specialized sigma24 family protein